jgi:SAM-dependent methyltransferase
VFLGIFIGIVPIYGFQTLAAVGLALIFRLNKPLIVASTFINNPFFQPVLIISSIEIGLFLRHGHFSPLEFSALTRVPTKDDLLSWVVGSLVLGVIVGGVGALITAVVVHLKSPANPGLRDRLRFVNQTFAQSASSDRCFVWCKLRLDRIFGMLAAEDLGLGTVVDLGCGCGYSMAFCNSAFGEKGRRLVGCDLNPHSIAVARQALASLNAEVSVQDVRHFELPSAGLILILDVLQYLAAEEQLALLKRCCSALDPQGRLIFRAHDRERGLRSTITLALDRLLFSYERTGTRPLILSAPQYQRVLEDAGMQVETRRFRNRLPLAHILFIAKKPFAEAEP